MESFSAVLLVIWATLSCCESTAAAAAVAASWFGVSVDRVEYTHEFPFKILASHFMTLFLV